MNIPFYLRTDTDRASQFLYNSGQLVSFLIIDLLESKYTKRRGHYVMTIGEIEVHEFHDAKCKEPYFDVIHRNDVERCFSYVSMLALVTHLLPSNYIFEAKNRLNLRFTAL